MANVKFYRGLDADLGNLPQQNPDNIYITTDKGEMHLNDIIFMSQNATTSALLLKANTSDLISHTTNTSNPHNVTASQIGMGNIDNTSDLNKPISTATTSALNLKANTADLSAVAFSGSYNDLIDQPAVPSPVTVVQTTGTSTTSVMSQNAVSVALSNSGNGDMLKSIYDTNDNGTVDKAEILSTARTIALDGDITGSNTFDGSTNVTITTLLSNSGITAGTYTKLTVNDKGLTTIGANLTASDIPILTLNKISDIGTAAAYNVGTSANTIVVIDSSGKLPQSVFPSLVITDTFIVDDETEMLGLTAQQGDISIRTDLNKSFILTTNDPTILNNWQELLTPTSDVTSVNGKTGTVILNYSDVGAEATFNKNTAFNQNFETSSSNIKMDGIADAGSTGNVADAGHIHPSDTSKLDKTALPSKYIMNLSNQIDNTTQTFTLTEIINNYSLFYNGLNQLESVDYTISGTSLTTMFTNPPQNGDNIWFEYWK